MSEKRIQWEKFSTEVGNHVDNYVVKQYGDFPDAMIESFSVDDIKRELNRYIHRVGKNSRGHIEDIRDCLKIAHYACYLKQKLVEKEK